MNHHPNDWTPQTIGDCISVLSLSGKPKVPTTAYKHSGQFPIVDQGQGLIAGWTDDAAGLIATDLPVIVFGDHTRAIKYLERPFVRGADGTQVLKPRADIDPLFLYYACRSVDVPSRGYNRHFSVLKSLGIAVPSERAEQERIGLVMRAVEAADTRQAMLADTNLTLKQAVMRELFARGLRGEPQKETEIGLVPATWEVRRLEDDHDIAGGGTPLRSVDAYWTGGTIPWVKTAEVNYSVIRSTEEHITQEGLDNSSAKLLPPGTLLIAMFGQGVTRGRVAILGIEATCNQACAAVRPRNDRVDTRFLYHLLTSKYEDLRQLAHGGQQQNLNIDIVRNFRVAVPTTTDEQQEMVAILDAIDRKIDIHRRKKAVLEELFRSLLHKLMTGEVRVADLDLSALPAPEEARS